LGKIWEKIGKNRRNRQYINQYSASLWLTRSSPDFPDFPIFRSKFSLCRHLAKTTTFSPHLQLLPETGLVLQKRSGDIAVRKNLTSSDWHDAVGPLRSRELIAGRADSEDDGNDDLLTLSEALWSPTAAQAALRWAVIASEDQRLHLQLQALLSSATVLNSRPIFKG
jgi:hypothetical protein